MWTRSRTVRFALSIVAAIPLSANFFAQTTDRSPERLIRQIDHLILASNDAERLYRLFTQQLQIPSAWPFRSYGTFSSGGLNLGDVGLELLLAEHGPYGLTRMALEPESLSTVLPQLDARGVPHADPAPYKQKDAAGVEHTLWTIVDLRIAPANSIFLCKYAYNVEERRRRSTDELRKNGGGPLGIESPAEVVLGARDFASAEHEWSRLLGPVAAESAANHEQGRVLRPVSGPAIRLIPAAEDHIAILRIRVKSLEQARVVLKREQLLGLDESGEISIDRSRVSGADIRFVDQGDGRPGF